MLQLAWESLSHACSSFDMSGRTSLAAARICSADLLCIVQDASTKGCMMKLPKLQGELSLPFVSFNVSRACLAYLHHRHGNDGLTVTYLSETELSYAQCRCYKLELPGP